MTLVAECASASENYSVAIVGLGAFLLLGFIVWLALR